MTTIRSRAAVSRQCLIPACLLAVACNDSGLPASPDEVAREHATHQVELRSAVVPADYLQQLAELRRATAPFHNFEKAQDAGWTLQFTPCIMNPAGTAGMGFHYVNPDLLDGHLDVGEPEALLYVPETNGRLRLLAVEYLVPFTVHPATAAPPELYGLPFSPSPVFQVWGLHAWVWRHNADGMHAPFNPVVNCDNA
jgi:hypothetical protein